MMAVCMFPYHKCRAVDAVSSTCRYSAQMSFPELHLHADGHLTQMTGIVETGCSSVSTNALGLSILTEDDGRVMKEDITGRGKKMEKKRNERNAG